MSALASAASAVLIGLAPAWPDTPTAAIDALFADWSRPDSPGASVAVIREGAILHAQGYGSAQLEYAVPIEPDTVFHVASVSKQFTAMALALLESDGRLSLDDPVRQHLDEMPDFGAPITIRHLLHHTSGLRDQWQSLALAGWRLDDVITTAHVLSFVSRQRELNFPPGERKLYSNTGYTLGAVIVSRVAGQPFPDFCRERIFEPLGMRSTHFHDDHQHLVPRRAYSYGQQGDGFQKRVLSYANAGATSLFTTAPDLARWLENFDHARVGGPAVRGALLRRGVLNDGTQLGYALGIVHGQHEGWKTLGHSGGDAGFRSDVLWFPDARLGVVVLSNAAEMDPSGKARAIASLLLEPAPKAETQPAPEAPAPIVAEAADPPPFELEAELLASYAGAYAMANGYALEVEVRRGRLYLRPDGHPRQRLRAESATAFASGTGSTRIVFEQDPGARRLTLQRGDHAHTFRRVDGPPPALDLSEYAGRYFSHELEALYSIEVAGGELLARHFRHGVIPLRTGWPDRFSGTQWFFQGVHFERDDDGRVSGFRASGGRVLNLLFERL